MIEDHSDLTFEKHGRCVLTGGILNDEVLSIVVDGDKKLYCDKTIFDKSKYYLQKSYNIAFIANVKIERTKTHEFYENHDVLYKEVERIQTLLKQQKKDPDILNICLAGLVEAGKIPFIRSCFGLDIFIPDKDSKWIYNIKTKHGIDKLPVVTVKIENVEIYRRKVPACFLKQELHRISLEFASSCRKAYIEVDMTSLFFSDMSLLCSTHNDSIDEIHILEKKRENVKTLLFISASHLAVPAVDCTIQDNVYLISLIKPILNDADSGKIKWDSEYDIIKSNRVIQHERSIEQIANYFTYYQHYQELFRTYEIIEERLNKIDEKELVRTRNHQNYYSTWETQMHEFEKVMIEDMDRLLTSCICSKTLEEKCSYECREVEQLLSWHAPNKLIQYLNAILDDLTFTIKNYSAYSFVLDFFKAINDSHLSNIWEQYDDDKRNLSFEISMNFVRDLVEDCSELTSKFQNVIEKHTNVLILQEPSQLVRKLFKQTIQLIKIHNARLIESDVAIKFIQDYFRKNDKGEDVQDEFQELKTYVSSLAALTTKVEVSSGISDEGNRRLKELLERIDEASSV